MEISFSREYLVDPICIVRFVYNGNLLKNRNKPPPIIKLLFPYNKEKCPNLASVGGPDTLGENQDQELVFKTTTSENNRERVIIKGVFFGPLS
jgi:hypothetical protein